MKRFLKGMSYTFKRNLGWQDRLVRALAGLAGLAVYGFGLAPGTVGVVLAVVGALVLATAVVSRCSICYMMGVCTIGPQERGALDARGIQYEA